MSSPVSIARGGALMAAVLMATLSGSTLPAGAATGATALYGEAMTTTRSWSVHYISSGSDSKVSMLTSGDAGPASGTQEVLVGQGTTADRASLVVIGGITYMNGDARALIDLTGLSALQAAATAGKWIQFATDNQVFSQVVAGVRSTDVAQELALKGPYRLGSPRRLDGYEVDPVLGTQHFPGLKTQRSVLYVRANGLHVPVEEDTLNAQGNPNGVEHTVFSHWGEMVRPLAPQATATIGAVSTA